jgi:hypothetical protein
MLIYRALAREYVHDYGFSAPAEIKGKVVKIHRGPAAVIGCTGHNMPLSVEGINEKRPQTDEKAWTGMRDRFGILDC